VRVGGAIIPRKTDKIRNVRRVVHDHQEAARWCIASPPCDLLAVAAEVVWEPPQPRLTSGCAREGCRSHFDLLLFR
jgi:hypothetical protein